MTRPLTTREARIADLADLAGEALIRFAVAWREESVKHSEARLQKTVRSLSPYENASAAKVAEIARDVREATAALSAMIPGIVRCIPDIDVGEED